MAGREKLIEKAQKYLQKGKYKDALKIYEKVLKESPDDVRIVLRKGEMEEKLGFDEDAIDSYQFVAQKYSDDGFYPKAIAIYKKILKINAEDMGVHMKLGTLYKKMNIDNEAKVYYSKVAEYYKANNLKQEYLDVVKIISEFTGEDTGSKIDLAQEYLEQGDRDQAIEQFRAASQRIFESANVRELDLLVEKMDRLGLEDLDTQTLQIRTYMQAKEPKKALKIIQKVYAAHPTNANVLEMLAACFKALHQPQKAVSVYDELIQIYKKNGEIDKANRSQDAKDLLMQEEGIEQSDVGLLEDLDEGLSKKASAIAGGKTEAESQDEEDLDRLASFDEVPFSESTVQSSKPKPKTKTKTFEDDAIEDLDFILSSEFSDKTGSRDKIAKEKPKKMEVEAETIKSSSMRTPKKQEDEKFNISSVIHKTQDIDQDAPTKGIEVSFADFEKKDDHEVSREIDFGDLTLDDQNKKVSDPFSEDVSDLSFQSFEEPIERSDISEEEISGLIDKPSKAKSKIEKPKLDDFSLSKLDEEMLAIDSDSHDAELNLSESISVQEPTLDAKEAIVEEERVTGLTDFDEFAPNAPEVSELSVNEEEFVMVQESLEEASLNDMSKEDSVANWSAETLDFEEGMDISISRPIRKEDIEQNDDSKAQKSYQEISESMKIELPEELSDLGDSHPLDFGDSLELDDEEEPQEEVEKTQYDPNNQTQVDFSTQDFSAFTQDSNKSPAIEVDFEESDFEDQSMMLSEEESSAKSIESFEGDFEEPALADENVELEVVQEQPKSGTPKTDLDNIQFATEHSFPEYELSNPAQKLPENISGSDFFDLAGSLKDEIEDLEKTFSSSSDDDDDEVEHLTPEEVILEFKKGISRTIDKSDSQTYYNLGVAYKEMGLIDEAISSFDIARKGQDYKVDASSLMGICYMDKREFDTAVKTFDEILQSISYQDPKALGIRYEKAESLIALGRHMEAYKEFQKIKDVDSHFRDVSTRAKELAFNLGIQEKPATNQSGKIIVNLKERKKNKL
ncbi:MAG: tetratricopeptide repeat protein [Bdellovibrionales bacterium]|nr:tetratricopeptide repeat protein [Bdellovibrionales bacterium]